MRLRLTFEVEYKPNGVPWATLADMLADAAVRALNDGTLTGETEAEVEQHRYWVDRMGRGPI